MIVVTGSRNELPDFDIWSFFNSLDRFVFYSAPTLESVSGGSAPSAADQLDDKFKEVKTLQELLDLMEAVRIAHGEDAVKEFRVALNADGTLKGFEFVIEFKDGTRLAGSDSVSGSTFGYITADSTMNFDAFFDGLSFGELPPLAPAPTPQPVDTYGPSDPYCPYEPSSFPYDWL